MESYGENQKKLFYSDSVSGKGVLFGSHVDRNWLGWLSYFINDGLKNFKNPKGSYLDYPTLIKESDLHYHLGLSKAEVKELLEIPWCSKGRIKRNSLLSLSAIYTVDVIA